jgi:hypothetical protein
MERLQSKKCLKGTGKESRKGNRKRKQKENRKKKKETIRISLAYARRRMTGTDVLKVVSLCKPGGKPGCTFFGAKEERYNL